MERFMEPVLWFGAFLAFIWLATDLVDTEPFLAYTAMTLAIVALGACFFSIAEDAGLNSKLGRFNPFRRR